MRWPFPAKDSDPWFEKFDSMVEAMDGSGYASREDRQLILGGGDDVTFDSGANTLSWTADIEVFSPISGFKLTVPADTVTILDGEVLYAVLTRAPQVNNTIARLVASSVPNTDDAFALCIRRDSTVYWRHGSKVENGETVNIFGVPGTANQGDTYERGATFGVPEGTSSDTATLGRILFQGSLIGVAAELTRPVTAGDVTVHVKVGGTTKLTIVLDGSNPAANFTVSAPGTHPVTPNSDITVEWVTTGYTNADTLDAGLTVNVTFATGVTLPSGGVPDASAGVKGVTKLSLDPVSAIDPIAVGDNDLRIFENRRVIRTISQPADSDSFTVSFSPDMPSVAYIVMHTLGTVSSHVGVDIPESGRAVGSFTVNTSAPLDNGDTIYFFVAEE
jgi:hypothetical protein